MESPCSRVKASEAHARCCLSIFRFPQFSLDCEVFRTVEPVHQGVYQITDFKFPDFSRISLDYFDKNFLTTSGSKDHNSETLFSIVVPMRNRQALFRIAVPLSLVIFPDEANFLMILLRISGW